MPARTWSVQVTRPDYSKTFQRLGQFPAVSYTRAKALAEAARVEARTKPAAVAIDPEPAATASTGDPTLTAVWEEYARVALAAGKWTQRHHDKTSERVQAHMADLLPRPVTEITRAQIVEACAALESVETGQRIYRWLRGAVDHAVDTGVIERSQFGRNVPLNLVVPASARGSLRGNLDMDQMRTLLRESWDSDAAWSVRALHRVVALSGHRIGAARMAQAEHLDLESAIWTMPRPLMKVKTGRPDFVIRMGPQLKAVMGDAHRRAGGKGLLFKGPLTGAALTEEAVEHHIRRLLPEGGKFSPHSWRTPILTWALEAGYSIEFAKAAIDHRHSTGATARYDAATFIDARAEILGRWADILDRE
jgi:hypothetical protein